MNKMFFDFTSEPFFRSKGSSLPNIGSERKTWSFLTLKKNRQAKPAGYKTKVMCPPHFKE